MGLPKQYSFLNKEKGPRILLEALALYGTIEHKGDGDNPVILNWAKEVGGWIADYYKHDSIAWCGLFVAVCAKRAGFPFGQKALAAREWVNWGLKIDQPMLGCVLIFMREGGGHVGLYVGEDDECYHVLGGNQGDAVSIARISKKRLIAARECPWKISRPPNARVIKIESTGTISENEA